MLTLIALLSLTSRPIDVNEIPGYVPRDVRLVDDAIHIPAQPPAQGHGLFLASVDAAYNSGHIIAEGPYINAKTGEYVEPPGSKYEMIIRGNLTVEAAIFGPLRFRQTAYKWIVREHRPDPEDAAYFSPFRDGGLALVGYNDLEAGARQFDPTYLVAAEWKPCVAPAFAYVRSHPSTFDAPKESTNRVELRRLLTGSNPMLTVFAAKTLTHSGGPDVAYVRNHWTDAPGILGAAVLLMVLDSSDVDAKALAARAATASVGVRRQVVLAGVAGLSEPRESSAYKNGVAILDAVKAEMAKSGHPYGTDPEVAYLLQMSGR